MYRLVNQLRLQGQDIFIRTQCRAAAIDSKVVHKGTREILVTKYKVMQETSDVSLTHSETRRKRATRVKNQISYFSIKATLSNSLLVDMFWVKDIIRKMGWEGVEGLR
jgi:hypothetical protein